MVEVTLNSIFTQLSLRKIAYFISSTLGNDIYYLKEFIDIGLSIIGEEKAIEMLKKGNSAEKLLGENWNKANGVKKQLIKLDKIIEKTKNAYDLLEDKTMKKNEKDYKIFADRCKKVSLIKPELFTLFVFLINNTTLKNGNIPSDYYKILEHKGFRAVGELDRRRVGEPTELHE
jgi:hypothetical protein